MRRAVLIAAAAAAVLAGGCGGGDSKGPPSKAEYQDQANEACITLNSKLQHLPVKAQQGSLDADQSQRLSESYSRQFKRSIAALTPPDSLRAGHRRLVRDLRAPAADPGKDLARAKAHIRALRDDYAALGIDVCRRGSQQALDTYARG